LASTELTSTTFQNLIDAGALEIGDGYRAKLSELGGDGPIFLRAVHVTDAGIEFDGVDRFKSHLTQQVRSKMAQPGDTVVTTKGNSTGRTAYVTEEMPGFVYSPHLSFWRSLDRKQLPSGFLRYWARGREFVTQLGGMKVSTDMAPYLSLTDQRRLRISLPSLSARHAIADVLSVLDRKIELNRRQNTTLDAMASALFKSWFVDFDPVIANATGRQPIGMSPRTTSAFPAHFMDSALGPLPGGWRVSTIGEEVGVVGGSTPSTDEPKFWEAGRIHWVTPRDMAKLTEPVLLDTDRRITSEGLRRISSGLLPVGTVLLSSRAPIGYLATTEIPVAINQGFVAMICTRELTNHYVRLWANDNMDEILSRAGGTTFAEISKRAFRPIPVLVPSRPVIEAFTAFVEPLHRRVVGHLRESRVLTKLRDTLFPKLMSGEICTRDAEKVFEHATV
jgi:type I restriction enzyme S subunit